MKSIDSYAFSKCENLSEIIFFEGLKEIGEGAFLGCGGIKKVSFPDSLKKIGDKSFSVVYPTAC